MASIAAGHITTILQFLAGAGGDPVRARLAAGIRSTELADPTKPIELDRFAAILSAAADELDDPAFALNLCARFDLEAIGLLAYAVLNASTVETAIDNLQRYIGTIIAGARLEPRRTRSQLALRLEIHGLSRRRGAAIIEGGTLLIVRMLRRLVADETWKPDSVHFAHGAPRETATHARYFGARPRFGARWTGIVLPASLLDLEVRDADRSALPQVEAKLREIVTFDEEAPWLARLRYEIATRLCDQNATLPLIAPEMGMSVRTLQRRLAGTGIAYRDLVREARHQLAMHYLLHTDLHLTEIAFLLGYSELSAFDHAFKRWAGQSPGHTRKHQRAAGGV